MKYVKLFENFSEEENPNTITLAFNGRSGYDKFKDQYSKKLGIEGGHASFLYQEDNWQALLGAGHPVYGKDGLEVKSGVFYPLFTHTENIGGEWTTIDWIFIYYSKEYNEVLIIQTNEYANVGTKISREITKHPRGPQNYCKFDKIEAGQIDHRGYFEIVSVK